MLQVLLIDDNPTQLRLRAAVLTDAGMFVAIAGDCETALALLGSSSPASFDVIVTDHMLPGQSGAAFVRQLRQVNSNIPVLAISGLPEAQEDYEGLNVRFLPKPVPPEDFIRNVVELGDSTSPDAAGTD